MTQNDTIALDYLGNILSQKREEVKSLPLYANPPQCKTDFSTLLKAQPCLIAEIKKKSPSEGTITSAFNPAAQLNAYIHGNADAISILTDEAFFGGSFDILKNLRQNTSLPILCKDFIIDERQLNHARVCGADMALLIVKALPSDRLHALNTHIKALGMMPLIEVQSLSELETALTLRPQMILVNSRNLTNFTFDKGLASQIIQSAPEDVKIILGSGITSPNDLKNYPKRTDGFLIGTTLMKHENPTLFLKQCRHVL